MEIKMKPSDLPLGKRIRFYIFGRVYLEHRQHKDGSKPNPFYLVHCPTHGAYEDYPHGFDSEFWCPKCMRAHRRRHVNRSVNMLN